MPTTTNVCAIGVVRYSTVILHWSDKELRTMGMKMMKRFGVSHKTGSVVRLNKKRKDGGRRLISVYDCVKE